jgi:hypothetical protein
MLFRSSAAPRIGLRSRISSLFREPRLEQPPTIASTMIRPNEVKVEVPLTLSLPEARVPKRERRRIFAEHFSKDFGMFYTIDRTLYKGSTLFQELEIVDTKEFGKVMILDGQTQVFVRFRCHLVYAECFTGCRTQRIFISRTYGSPRDDKPP